MQSYKLRISFKCFCTVLFSIYSFNSLADKKYASPSGNSANSGLSEFSPWSLAYAFSENSNLSPGDTLVLLSGIYEGNFSFNKSGTSQKPIYILPKVEGKSIIDPGKNRSTGRGIIVNGSNVWLIGLHITSSSEKKEEI